MPFSATMWFFFDHHVSHLFAETDRCTLRDATPLSCVADDIAPDHHALRFPLDQDPRPSFPLLDAVVLDHVVDQPIAMPGHAVRLSPEIHAVPSIVLDDVLSEKVVGVLVSDRDPESAVPHELVVLEEAVTDAPAEEQPVTAVPASQATAHHGSL